MILPGYFLPGQQRIETRPAQRETVKIDLPLLSTDQLERVIDLALRAREISLARRPAEEILSVIDRATALWLDPTYQGRHLAEQVLPALTGFSPAMIRHVLPLIFRGYRGERLEEFLREELGDGWCHQGRERPRLLTAIQAGNIPGLAVSSIVFSLLIRAVAVIKTSSREPLLGPLFARTIAEVDPEVGECVVVLTWQGGDSPFEEVVFTRSDLVMAYGRDETIAALRRRISCPFIGHGHKLSFGVIGREALEDCENVAVQAAYDVALYDQQGCLSPHLLYVEKGGPATPEDFARALASALDQCERNFPRGPCTPEESVAIRKVRAEAEWQAIAGKKVTLLASPGSLDWTVIYEEDQTFRSSPLNRTVRVKPLEDVAQVAHLLRSWRPYLAAIGLAFGPSRWSIVADFLSPLRPERFCPIGTMQCPGPAWDLRDLRAVTAGNHSQPK